MANHKAVYTGSFDPMHLGHENIIRRAASLFDFLIVGIGINPEKTPLFSPEERVEMIENLVGDLPNVSVQTYQGLTVSFVQEQQARVLVRGIRALADLDYEFTMSLTNSSLDATIETIFLMAQTEFTHLSSSLIRQIAQYGGNLDGFVSASIQDRLREKCVADS